MEQSRNWYALFSHTGKEIEAIIKQTGIVPNGVYTNNMHYDGPLKATIAKHDSIMQTLTQTVPDGSVITLNGYMRIIPEEFIKHCNKHKIRIYNIHPANINRYPELKGADPQERLFEGLRDGRYRCLGAVIHRVSPQLDGGPIVYSKEIYPPATFTKDDIYRILHAIGTQMWVKLIEEGLFYG